VLETVRTGHYSDLYESNRHLPPACILRHFRKIS